MKKSWCVYCLEEGSSKTGMTGKEQNKKGGQQNG